jgi:hypothetical protein
MKLRGDSYLFIVVMVMALAVIGLSLRMEYFSSKLLPVLISIIVFVLAGIGLGRQTLVGGNLEATATVGETSKKEETGREWLGYLLQGAWVVVFFLAIYLLGFMISIPLFVLFYMKSFGTRWRVAIIFAVLTPALIYALFQFALGIDLYPGLLFSR